MSKQSFTYSGNARTRKDAIKKAKKEGMIFSELVEKLLKAYVAAESWKTMDIPDKLITKEIVLTHD